ncbi:MAG: murein transglycosylase [Thalassobaculaceae bacterium]
MFRSVARRLIRLLPLLMLAAPAAAAPPTPAMDNLCRAGAEAATKSAQLPAGLLTAISLRETGRWSARLKTSLSWPWTVTARGKGHYLDSKGAAIAFVKRLQKSGISNIDVGCMQINLHYHADAFATLQDAFDPRRNARYAADFLTRLRDNHGGLAPAVARYHSGDPARGERYRAGVFDLWRSPPQVTNHRTATAKRMTRKAALAARRAAQRAAQAERHTANRQALAARQAAFQAARAQRATEKAARRAAFAAYKAAYLKRWRAQRAGKDAS